MFNQINNLSLIDLIIFSIYTLVEFNSFKIPFPMKTRTMMDDTEKIMLLTLILRRTRREKKNYSCNTFKTSVLGARYF